MCVSMRLCMCMACMCIEHMLRSAATRAWGWVWCTGAECARFSGSIWKVSSLRSAREAAQRRRGDGGEVAREEVRAEAGRASRRRWCFGEGFGEGFNQLDPLEPRQRGDGGSETAEARARSREPRRLRRGDGEREMAVAGRPRRRRAGRAPTDRARPSRSKGTCAAKASEAACAAKAWTCV